MSSNFNQIVQKVLGEVDIEREELLEKISQKQDELSGFVTPEGAATIVARSYGIVPERKEPEVRKLRIGDLSAGMSGIEIVGRVALIYSIRDFERKDGSPGKVVNLLLQDKTEKIRVVLWDEKAVLVEEGEIEKGTPVRLKGAYVKRGFRGELELNLGRRGDIEIDPEDERAEDLPPLPESEVKIADLDPELEDVDLIARVIAVTEPRTFERSDGSTGKVASLILADETGQTRASLWNDKADLSHKISQGDAIKIENAYAREGWGNTPEVHVGRRGRIILSPPKSETSRLPEFEKRLLKIDEVEPDMPVLDLAARVRRVFQPQEFERDDGTSGRVMNAILADETGTIRASFWDDMVEECQKLSPDDVVLFTNARSRMGLGDRPEIRVGKRTGIEINPKNLRIEEQKPGRIELCELEPGLDTLEIIGRVMDISETREFTRSDGSQGRVASLTIGDQTGTARVAFWGEKTDLVSSIEKGDVIKLINCYSTAGLYGQPEIHVSGKEELKVNPTIEEDLPPLDELTENQLAEERVNIGKIKKEGVKVQVRGTIVRVLQRRPIFDICPECGRSLGSVDSSLFCEECGKVVSPEHRVAISTVVDDGTGNIRTVAFGKVGEELIGKTADEVFELFKESSNISELYDEFNIAGKEIILTGTSRHDKYFDQLELRVESVKAPDPTQEAAKLLEKVKA
ncbi:hypothetical protein AKJ45_00030 [candidate division MSBL1 archaeon SCGC-AAA261F19]|uniref:Replication factor A n=1 Tax=candidate division MSBL1 archaeon SCGC-AAA261F19 TaxID=1698275 RepID=A0A133VBP8_9EURY|nr:hypothetical protein AKJ45_00030 [candidate division MSBL1 archaeon SCGC-AAA261F19]